MVDLPQALGISFRNFCKSYKSFFKKWHSKAKNSSKKDHHTANSSDVVLDRDDPKHDDDINNNNNRRHSKDRKDEVKKEGSRTMKGVHSLRYGARSMRENDATNFRPRSYDSGVSSLSRNASRRSQHLQSSSSSLFRSVSKRSGESATSRVSSGRRSVDSVASSPKLLKSGSRMSTTPIMYSSSSGVLKPAPIEKQLECTLEELCFGCMKKIKITRDVLSITGQTTEEEETLTINVKPGWKKGTKITFEGMGSERPGSYPADISFVIAEKGHSYFRREGDDLELTLEIPLIKALTGCTISVPVLGGETMSLEIHDVIWPGYEKIIEGQGMAKPKEDKRGNLIVKFLVEFPTQLTDQQRSDVCQILECCDYSS